MSNLLVDYIRLALKEAHLARVPQQLLSPSGSEEGLENEGSKEGVNEFSGVGAIAGYTGPLGASPDTLGRKRNAPKRKK